MYAEVLVQYGAKSLDHTFTYHIPDELNGILSVGMKVVVPFGSRYINGFVTNIVSSCNIETKDIKSIINLDFKLNKELMLLGNYLSDITLCSKVVAYQTMLPTSLKINNSKESYSLNDIYIKISDINLVNNYINEHKKALKQIDILNRLKEGKINKKDINSSILKILINNNLVIEEKIPKYRINPNKVSNDIKKLTLEQESAYNEINNSLDSYKTFLLYGVTGSGKTEVYMHLCDSVISNNKSVIILVPEISLTTQLVNRFYNRFGSDVAIFHSELSDGEKYDEYKKIVEGSVHIVVGTRSAIFTPVKNLGLIVIDEEHSSTYKQENNPRYNALDIAVWRCKYNNCPLVLGSATPSLESMARALKGVYKLIELKHRVGSSMLPSIEIVNMQDEYKKRNMILSDELKINIEEKLEKNEQVMLLINRRGYSTFVTCESCGYTYKCPHCDITLTYHKSSNSLRCHYCGYTVIFDGICPNCHEKSINSFGLGTEKVEKLLRDLYPSARIVRMDADTTTRKGSHQKIIKGIENLEYDIVVGTQMIAKGLDFPNVTLVGIINADESLNIPDFRSGENTFALLSQVAGRAGRSDKKGKVIIQTFNPDNKTLNYVLHNDYMGNYLYEMNIRHILKYPPYYFLTSIKVTSKDYKLASTYATKTYNYLKNNISSNDIILGPTTASQFKINNIYRFQIIIKYKKDDNLFNVLKSLDNEFITNSNVNIEIDNNPIRI